MLPGPGFQKGLHMLSAQSTARCISCSLATTEITDRGEDDQLQALSRAEAIKLVRVLQQQLQAKETEIAALRCVAACGEALKSLSDKYRTKASCGAEARAVNMF